MTTNPQTQQVENPYLPFGDQRTAPFYGSDILSVLQFEREDLEYIFGVAHEMREMVSRVGTFDLLKGKILANLFYESSTRAEQQARARDYRAEYEHIRQYGSIQEEENTGNNEDGHTN